MYKKRIYGKSRIDNCPFCEKQAIAKNKQGLLVCKEHTNTILDEIKCTCGSYLELKSGKFGPYFNCINCGNINFEKGLEIKEINKGKTKENKETTKEKFNYDEERERLNKLFKKKELKDSGKYDGFDYEVN